MIVCYFWRDCNFRGRQWDVEPIDAFWVEATREEAEATVFHCLEPTIVRESEALAHKHTRLAERLATALGTPPRPFCFLVARDLSTIDPFHVHYPFHQLWNAYSPFERMPEQEIVQLYDLTDLVLPPKIAGT